MAENVKGEGETAAHLRVDCRGPRKPSGGSGTPEFGRAVDRRESTAAIALASMDK
jgi:hypothetical protein